MSDPERVRCVSCRTENLPGAETCFRCGKGLFAVTEGALLAGRYEILEPLGKGGMGMVYKAHDRELDEIVAVKVLRPEVAGSLDAAKRFRSEIKLARKVRHRNVCAIHEYGQDDHLRFIVMEYVRGTDLKQVLKASGPMLPDQALSVGVQIADGLHAIHEAGIVHRDLKTPNIILDERGIVRLMDFGIAKQFGAEGTTGGTATGHVIGTPEYMSPEQARAERIDARSDVYALGIVLFELFTGTLPFRGDTPMATLLKHLQEAPPLEAPTAALVPAAAKPILARALAKEADRRYSSAHEIANELRAALAATPSVPVASHLPLPGRGSLARNPEPRTGTESLPTPVPTPVPTPIPTPTPAGASATWRPFVAPPLPEPSRDVRRPANPPAARRLGIRIAAVAVPMAALLLGWIVFSGRGGPGNSLSDRSGSPLPSPSSVTGPVGSVGVVTSGPDNPASTAPLPASTMPRRPDAAPSAVAERPVKPRPSPSAVTAAERVVPPARPETESVAPNSGLLKISARPYAEVSIDGRSVGTSPPLPPLRLPAGTHTVRLVHPDYLPLPKRVVIRANETTTLDVDMSQEAFHK